MERSVRQHPPRLVLVGRFVRARWGYRFRSRAHFDRWQQRRIRRFLRRVGEAPYYAAPASPASSARRRPRRLAELPVIDKTVLLENFDALNTRGVRLADAMAVAVEAERTRDFSPTVAGDLTVGLSSGTSGRRGAFLVSPRERMLWAGTVLARVLDRAALARLLRPWLRPLRIAFFLRAGGALYESVSSRRVRFAFFDLTRPLVEHVALLDERAEPSRRRVDVLVAPASVLRSLAERTVDGQLVLHPGSVVSVAEVLEPDTAELILRAWGVHPRQVYQATEGLLALSCEEGALHLNEESVHVEKEWLDAQRRHFIPVITDFDRRTQVIARYRLDDVLRVDPTAPERCRCGRVTTLLAAVDGRADAVLRLPSHSGQTVVEVFPDAVRQAMVLGSESYADWRIHQTGLDIRVALRDPSDDAFTEVREALDALFDRYGCAATVLEDPWLDPDPTVKARRIVRETPARETVRGPAAEPPAGATP